jgi:uncharacterized protein YecE (DUF72 family)
MSRYLTHIKRLKEPSEPIARFLDRAAPIGKKLGPVLVQLPTGMKRDGGRLEALLSTFPKGIRVAVELRDDSWLVPEIEALLARHRAAFCVWDRPDSHMPLWRTADWGYVRFHEGMGPPRPCYGGRALASWARQIGRVWPEPCEVYAFFNNDAGGCAVRDARLFALAAERVGLAPTGVPPAADVHVPAAP